MRFRAMAVECERFDVAAVPVPELPSTFAEIEHLERSVAALKLRAVRRIHEARAAQQMGERSTAEWLARNSGTTVGSARQALEASKQLGATPEVEDALARGELSEQQAKAIADAASVAPEAAEELVEAAREVSTRELKDRCAQAKANARPDRHEAIRRSRSCRTWTDSDGAWHLHVRHLPEVGAEIEARLAPFTHQRFTAARKAGEREPREAYAADAMLDLARASASPKGASRADTKVLVHVDVDTLVRGERQPGSRCDIDGIGPVDVDWVRRVYGEAFVAFVFSDTVGVRGVAHLGRQVTAHQRTAVEARGYRCQVPGCARTDNLQIDHRHDWALVRRTTVDDLDLYCEHHHRQKTHHGWRLTGPPGSRRWIPPPAAA